ncbi:TPA: 30S ribosomal protein S17 [Candidatus Micrarchaeota archaeon]|nr:30S ribosomal protein S17P [uncultured archaeon]HIH19706.1 30S ribosomal protein S17 [Candidatus Micrarchaeota archaeon]
MVECSSPNCLKHGNLRVRGLVDRGLVVSAKAKNTAVVVVHFVRPVPKFERVEKRRSKIHVHVPPCESVKDGDYIEFGECRKISKTKSHVFMRKIRQGEKQEAKAEPVEEKAKK